MLITNITKVKQMTTLLYSLFISSIESKFVEKSKSIQNKVYFDYKKMFITLNDKEMNQRSLGWFLDKVISINNDVEQKKCDVMKPKEK